MTELIHSQTVYDQILGMFISEDDFRLWMATPFLIGDKVAATDGHSLVTMPNKGNLEYDDRSDKTRAVYPVKSNCNAKFTVQQFHDALSKVPLIDGYDEKNKFDYCEECSGAGEVEFEYYANSRTYYHDAECPVCGGSGKTEQIERIPNGKMVPDETKLIKIWQCRFSLSTIRKLIKVAELLKEDEITMSYQIGERSFCLFNIGECEVLAMPELVGDDQLVAATIQSK